MFAIIETGGNQYKVSVGEVIDVEKLDVEEGKKVTLDRVLLLKKEGGETVVGTPLVEKAKVEAEVVKNFKDDKVVIFKKQKRQNHRRKKGHRQQKTLLKITKIVA